MKKQTVYSLKTICFKKKAKKTKLPKFFEICVEVEGMEVNENAYGSETKVFSLG